MTASGRLRRFCGFCGMSAYPPKLTVEADIPDQTASSSFDHLVGAREHRGRNFEPERLGSLEVDHDLVFVRRLVDEIPGALRRARRELSEFSPSAREASPPFTCDGKRFSAETAL
jgi:hypothetical protein